ncbi:hypothetical protein [Pseudomonas laurylsulfatiphila]|jgi:hypothetical protein|uniref:hypothetical protein n=1 Tax=Pseudomonas laurylsulfatiphila TaxID=2011015 RepID=UPI002160D06D|nr:hypothetical protein [Pseudomonas laurylsulfatiphila]UVM04778.1 hypothetical protein LOY25_27925 [Pseudomonas laurylsulfatiphila]
MKPLYKYLNYIYPALLVITSSVAIFTIVKNLSSDVYNIDKDSIGIPIGAILIAGLVLLTLHIMQIFLYKKSHTHHTKEILTKISALIISAASLAILADSINYWATPNHLIISTFYSISTIAFLTLQLQMLKKFQ